MVELGQSYILLNPSPMPGLALGENLLRSTNLERASCQFSHLVLTAYVLRT